MFGARFFFFWNVWRRGISKKFEVKTRELGVAVVWTCCGVVPRSWKNHHGHHLPRAVIGCPKDACGVQR